MKYHEITYFGSKNGFVQNLLENSWSMDWFKGKSEPETMVKIPSNIGLSG